jgi:hypothetical protein
MLTRLIYISRSKLPEADVAQGLRAISETANARNALLSITGALLHTGSHFAQVIEGAPEDIDTLMASLYADKRHDALQVIEQCPVEDRQFSAWMTVYNGRARYIQGVLDACLEQPDSPLGHRKLLQLFKEFSRDYLLIMHAPSRFG